MAIERDERILSRYNLEQFGYDGLEDVYWDNFISDYLRNVIGLNDWDIGKLMSFEEVCVESDDETGKAQNSTVYFHEYE